MNNELIERVDEELERIRAEEDAFESLEGSVMHIARDIERRKSLWNDCKASLTQQCGVTAMSNPCVAAIQFALEADDGLIFLRLWNEGEFDAIRNEWHDVPEAVFIGSDPLHPGTNIPAAQAQVPEGMILVHTELLDALDGKVRACNRTEHHHAKEILGEEAVEALDRLLSAAKEES